LYNDIYKKAACYLYFINKFHPFNNGNKRISIVATFVFLLYNDIEFIADEDEMYIFAKRITVSTQSQDKEFDEVVKFIMKYSKRR
jgi:death-on-curing protein